MRRLITAGAGVGVIGAVAYKPFYDPIRFKSLNEVNDSYDYIIVGSGTTGSVVARRLAQQAHKPSILLIEAGPPDTFHPLSKQVIPIACTDLLKTNIDWEFYTEPNENACKGLIDNRSYWPRGRVCGGSSVLNAMFYVRGHPNDFNQWEQDHGCKGWSYENVLPYFKKIEDPTFTVNDENKAFRGTGGPQKVSIKTQKNEFNKVSDLFIQACNNKGFQYNEDYNGATQDGVGLTQFNTYRGRRMTSFRSYIAPLFNRFTKKTDYNIDILPNSQVTKILTKNGNSDKLKADGIELVYNRDNNSKKIIKTNFEVILSAGAICSPQLLMLSGIGPKQELEEKNIKCIANIPGVGKNLQDHMLASIRLKMPKNVPLLSKKEGQSLKTIMEYFFKGTGWLTSITTDVQLFCVSQAGKKLGLKTNDLQIVACPGADEQDSDYMKHKYHVNVDDETFGLKDENDYWSMMGLVFPLHPTSIGEITLRNNNPLEYPIIKYEYLQTDYDKECYVDGILLLKDILSDKIYKELGCELVIDNGKYENDEQYWSREAVLDRLQNDALTCYHPVGTCKMGNIEKDEMAVCDERLKVRGFENLRVMDASIMPTLTSGNTQSPCYMIGEKGSDMVIQDNQQL